MSLAIDIDKITRICVAGQWHEVKWYEEDGEYISTFLLDAYEFIKELGYEHKSAPWDRHIEHGGGASGICSTGFEFVDDKTGERISGPMTSMDAVAIGKPKDFKRTR